LARRRMVPLVISSGKNTNFLRRAAAVKVEYSIELLMSFDASSLVGKTRVGVDELVANALMGALMVIEIAIEVDGVTQSTVSDEGQTIQTFFFV
jgi:hypothetical protein